MPPRQCAGPLTQVLVPATPARIEDTPALEISRRNRKPVQSPFTERIVYKKPSRDRPSSRRSAETRAGRVNTSFSDVEDEITEMRIKSESSNNCIGPGVGVHIPRDNILEEDNSLPLTKLEYKLENHELTRGSTGKDGSLSRLKIDPAKCGDVSSVSSTRVRVSEISQGKAGRSSEREILSCKAESGIVKVSKQTTVNKVSSLGKEKMRRKSPRKVQESGENVGRRTNLRSRTSDLSELPLSHVKQMRQKIKKSAILKTKKLKNLFLKKKLNGRLILQSGTAEVRARLRDRKTEQLAAPPPPSSPPPSPPAQMLDTEFPCLSLTVFDADVARPSRPIHRPVRYLDSLNQNADNIEIKKLSLVDKFDLPYNKESLCWNKSHSKNKQVKLSQISKSTFPPVFTTLFPPIVLVEIEPFVLAESSTSISLLRYFLLIMIIIVVVEHLLLLWRARQLAREDGEMCEMQPVVPREMPGAPALHHAGHTRRHRLAVRLQSLQLRLGVPQEDGHGLG